MARQRPEGRLDQLVECAARVFTARGYRRTQMADIARAMGIAPGTLYLYVESKEALFDLVIQRGFRNEPLAAPPRLPVPTPTAGTTVAHVRERLRREGRMPALETALARATVKNARAELEGVIRELYHFTAAKRRAIALIERSALDWPEIHASFFTEFRPRLLRSLTRYLERRMASKQLRRAPHPAAAARLIVETTAWFAMHRHGDPGPATISDSMAEETVIDALVNAFAQE